MATTDDGAPMTGPQTEAERARLNKSFVHSWMSRLCYYTAVIALESVVVGVANMFATNHAPWAAGMNLIAGLLALLACLYPVLAIRANTKKPSGSMIKTFLKVSATMHPVFCVLLVLADAAFIALSVSQGHAVCGERHEYHLHLAANTCTPGPDNLQTLAVLDSVLCGVLAFLHLIMGWLSHSQRSILMKWQQD